MISYQCDIKSTALEKNHFVASSLFSLGDSNQIHSIAGSLGSDWRREIDSEAKKKMKARS